MMSQTRSAGEVSANPKKEEREHRIIGARPVRHDGYDKVTGRARYGADVHLPGMLYGAVYRSPHAHARIRAIDTRAAEALPGVRAIVTAADLPAPRQDDDERILYRRWNTLARGRALYYGHAIAAVAATTPHIAAQAASLIAVEYERLPPLLDLVEAMKATSPRLLEEKPGDGDGQLDRGRPNVTRQIRYERGDVEVGFARAAVVVERVFRTATVHQGYIEPQSATALCQDDGRITIWCSNQSPFDVRRLVAEILAIPTSDIRVVPMEIGGGFGGKFTPYLEPLAVMLSSKSGHLPTKMVMSRADVLKATGPGAGSHIRVRMGADKKGQMTAAEAYLHYEAGAFPGSTVDAGARTMFAAYDIPNLQIEGYSVVLNKPKTADYRGSTSAIAVSAAEIVIDELCEKLHLDPLAFRLLNGAQAGARRPSGELISDINFRETVEAAAIHPHYAASLGGPNRGRGVAAATWGTWGGISSARASLNADGTVDLVTGSVDLSGTQVTLAMQLAETLGIPVERVRPRVGDTDSVGFTDGSYGSRTAFATGIAVHELGQRLKEASIQAAARLWRVRPETVKYDRGLLSVGRRRFELRRLAQRLASLGEQLEVSTTVNAESGGRSSAVHIVDVVVDPETGKVDILRYTAFQDVGRAIHPGYVEGQIQGAVAQGAGWALTEQYIYDDEGHLLNSSLLDYRLPTCPDLPMIDAVLLEFPSPDHPYGVRGVGELPILPSIAAIANAIHAATGIRARQLPITPSRLLEAMWARDIASSTATQGQQEIDL